MKSKFSKFIAAAVIAGVLAAAPLASATSAAADGWGDHYGHHYGGGHYPHGHGGDWAAAAGLLGALAIGAAVGAAQQPGYHAHPVPRPCYLANQPVTDEWGQIYCVTPQTVILSTL